MKELIFTIDLLTVHLNGNVNKAIQLLTLSRPVRNELYAFYNSTGQMPLASNQPLNDIVAERYDN